MDGISNPTPEYIEDVAHNAPRMAAFAFIRALWADLDLRAAWPLVDPLFRRCWVQAWLTDQRDLVRSEGYEPDDVVEAFASDWVEHALWRDFELTQLPAVGAVTPADISGWGLSARPDPMAPDIELLKLMQMPAGEHDALVDGEYVPFLMRYEAGPGWRVLSMVGESVPAAGWPPSL